MTIDATTIRTAVASISDDYELHEEVRRTHRHLVYEVTIDGRRAVCKHVLEDADREPLARETMILKGVERSTDLSLPTVLGAGDGFAVFSWVAGEPFHDDVPQSRQETRLRTLGRALAHLHNSTADWFDGFGSLTTDSDDRLQVENPSPWGECWEALVDDWLDRLAGTPHEDLRDAICEATRRATDRGWFDDVEPVLTHADAGPANVQFTDTDEALLVDWEGAMAFPGEYDIARACTDFFDLPHAVASGTLREALFDGYRDIASLPPRSHRRRCLYRATLTAKFLPGGVRAADAGHIDEDPAEFREALRTYAWRQLEAVNAEF
ncbi:phosphotransferase family protein [Haloarchaeobius sp. HME9146]|uniref:phosphotransferase family protein n=1 Tax=Haloarchaeobius sp. HME9146 TaxID=2978732 RepID=UPI0021BFD6D3|nr:aminoglycoside phosphotransferase family protein [Haloarchaeobius sp. HME9146]MCT9096509.1 aminoglycoside phosphotransferase family protein [Haloarchaeobius sp. HME9146]